MYRWKVRVIAIFSEQRTYTRYFKVFLMVLLIRIGAAPHKWHNEGGADLSAVHMQPDVAT
jgi:hypothetical protein